MPFRAASLPFHFHEWTKITSDPVILQYVLHGIDIEFHEWPQQNSRPVTVMDEAMSKHMDDQVAKLVQQGVLVLSGPEPGDFYSRVFLRAKKDGVRFRARN